MLALTFRPNSVGDTPDELVDIALLVEQGRIGAGQALRLLRKADARAAQPPLNAQEDNRLEEALGELDSLIGLTEVKRLVRELCAFVEIQKRRQAAALATEPLVLHMVFRGNPGTGKTTVARILGKVFREMGVLQKGHLVEVERADLVGEYIGHTAQKTREQIKRAMGGILFIDEAYSLARGGEKDFGKEAIDVLVKSMEDHKDNLVLILAGYKDEMSRFLRTNPGLKSRFPIHIAFDDYSTSELLQICDLMLRQREYTMAPEARAELATALDGQTGMAERLQGNARLVRNIIERAIRRQAVRLVAASECSRDALMTISAQDLCEALCAETTSRSA